MRGFQPLVRGARCKGAVSEDEDESSGVQNPDLYDVTSGLMTSLPVLTFVNLEVT